MSGIEKLEPVFRLTALGWKVYPCSRPDYNGPDPGKSPWCEHGFRDATADAAKVIAWASEKPGCNWGVWPRDGVCVLDADVKHGGLERLKALEAEHGPLPLTAGCQTGGGGRHLYFACPPAYEAKAKLGCDGLELIAGKGGVIIPPSIHAATGKPYVWLVPPWETPPAPAPAWLLGLAQEAKAKSQGFDLDTLICSSGDGSTFADLGPVPEHERNDPLCEVIGRHFRRGESEEEVLEQALAWAAAQEPPYDAEEMARKVKSIARKEREKAQASQQPPPPPPYKVSVGVTEDCSDGLTVQQTINSAPAPDAELIVCCQPSDSGDNGQGGPELDVCCRDWPTLSEEAYHGLIGEIVKAIEPETEADPAGVLVSLLCCFGSAVGRSPFFAVSGGEHHANLYACLVGLSSAGKGQAWDAAKYVLRHADEAWLKECVGLGLSSGEGLVKRVRDAETEQRPIKDEAGVITGFDETIVEAGAKDKRLLCLETEFQRLLAVSRREGNTLSAILRSLWDFGSAEVLTKNPLRATDAHVSILAHVTKEELDAVLANKVEMVNGFANRFLWCHVQERPDLPDGGNFAVLDRYSEALASALAKAKTIGEMKRSEEAAGLWRERYGDLRRAGNRVKACERARPQTLRLSMLYALADGTAEIGLAHLRAGLAVWRYCEASARYLFQPDNKPTPPSSSVDEARPWERLLATIYAKPGIDRTGLREAVGRKVSIAEMDSGLTYLERNRLAHRRKVQPDGGGRPAECWYPGPGPGTEPSGPNSKQQTINSASERADDGEPATANSKQLTPADAEADPGGAELVVCCTGPEPTGPDGTKKEERTNSPCEVADCGDEGTKKEESPPTGPEPDFVLSSSGPEPTQAGADAQSHDDDGGGGFVVGPEGRLGLSGQADAVSQGKPLLRERWRELYQPSAESPAPPLPERQPGESDEDYFMRRLELA